MSILGDILGTGDVIKEGFKLIDDIHTSDVEMIEAKTKAKTDLLAGYAPFKKAQRYIAIAFTFVFLLCFFLVMACSIFDIGDLTEIRYVIEEFWIGPIMAVIVGFYFGGGAFEGANKMKELRKE